MKSPGLLATPRPEPGHLLPALAGSAVILFALPLFLILDWNMKAWALAAALWVGIHALDFILRRARKDTGNLAASGMQAFGLLFKTLGLLVVLFAVAASDRAPRTGGCPRLRARLHVGARALDGRLLRGRPMKSRLLAVVLFALAFPQAAFARGEFDPVKEFEQHEWVSIHLGPLDLSITKAVVYLMLATVLTIFIGIFLMRVKVRARRSAGSSADDRRADLRGRAGADRRAGLADEGDPPVVPLRGLSLPLHLRRQPAGLHSACR